MKHTIFSILQSYLIEKKGSLKQKKVLIQIFFAFYPRNHIDAPCLACFTPKDKCWCSDSLNNLKLLFKLLSQESMTAFKNWACLTSPVQTSWQTGYSTWSWENRYLVPGPFHWFSSRVFSFRSSRCKLDLQLPVLQAPKVCRWHLIYLANLWGGWACLLMEDWSPGDLVQSEYSGAQRSENTGDGCGL